MKLTEFAQANPSTPGSGCSICALDKKLLAEIETGMAQGVPATTIGRWLVTHKGLTRSANGLGQAVRRHWKDCKHGA